MELLEAWGYWAAAACVCALALPLWLFFTCWTLRALRRPRPLDDPEIRDLTLWETDAEIPAFRAGWLWLRTRIRMLDDSPSVRAGIVSLEVAIGDIDGWAPGHYGQNERIAWQRGAKAARAVYRVLWELRTYPPEPGRCGFRECPPSSNALLRATLD